MTWNYQYFDEQNAQEKKIKINVAHKIDLKENLERKIKIKRANMIQYCKETIYVRKPYVRKLTFPSNSLQSSKHEYDFLRGKTKGLFLS
jgi:hypothetical protein